MWFENNMTSSDDDDVEGDSDSAKERRKRQECSQVGGLSRKCARQNTQWKGSSGNQTTASVTPYNKMMPPGRQRAGLTGVRSMPHEGGPGIAVTGSGASISPMSQVVSNTESVHYSESSAVREFVRSHVYPRKKTIFCDAEVIYGSNLANKVIEFMLYSTEGFYRGKKEPLFTVRRAVEVNFWTRNQEPVRRVLKEKVNNALAHYREKMESKCRCLDCMCDRF